MSKIKRTIEGSYGVVCPYCRSADFETQTMGHGPYWDPNQKSCCVCGYVWKQMMPREEEIERQEALPDVPSLLERLRAIDPQVKVTLMLHDTWEVECGEEHRAAIHAEYQAFMMPKLVAEFQDSQKKSL